MRSGIRLGIDVGDVRIGVARCDAAGMLATPAETVRPGEGDLDRIVALVGEYEVVEVVVGLPRVLSGREGVAAEKARAYAGELAGRVQPVPVRLVDERLSTAGALAGFAEAGVSTRRSRSRVDQAAAALILQTALDAERNTGAAPGELIRLGCS